jgi:histidinol dehydrogenase/phosphoribosyl-ATP pyrophosphohydrolase
MLIASIDIMNGQAVQLRQGKTLVLEAGDPRELARKFAPLGEIAVIDLDAAMGKGSNAPIIREMLSLARCRVGGGIRDAATALEWLHAGAAKVIIGTAATQSLLSQLPRERVIVALDARDGEVVVEGWVKPTGRGVIERIEELRGLVGGFLVTFVEIEGTLSGLDAARVDPIVRAAAGCRVTAAGGIRTAAEIGALDRAGADAQVGMALYQGLIHPADGWSAALCSDRPDGLWPTIVADESGVALGLVYSNAASLRAAVDERAGVFWSRSRNGLWRKGETSGAVQKLVRLDVDCDRDAIRVTVRQEGTGFCHEGTRTCFGDATGIAGLQQRVADMSQGRGVASGSYTQRLFNDPALLASKIAEEGRELAAAVTREEVIAEAADVIYFASVRLAASGVQMAEVGAELDRRALRISRRGGDAKPAAGVPLRSQSENAQLLPQVSPEQLLGRRVCAVEPEALAAAGKIMADVESRGWEAAVGHAKVLGDITDSSQVVYTRPQLASVLERVRREDRELLLRTKSRIERFALAQRACLADLDLAIEGGRAGHVVSALESAGCYAPGGRFPLPSSVLMTAVTARAAGVERVWVASPRPTDITLAAAAVAGVDGLIAIGGAQAIGAMTFGVASIGLPACAVIVGPGNRFVTAAKHLATRHTRIDMLAGPSEVLIIADASADPEVVAADLLAQAEHDTDASAILITTDSSLPNKVRAACERQLERLSTRATAMEALRRQGRVVVVDSVDEAIALSDSVAPEHLEVMTVRAADVASRLRHYGALFVGGRAAEVLGDYGAGPNHVLPTGGLARSVGGLSVLDFLKVNTRLACEAGAEWEALCKDAAALARLEGLEAHASAAGIRLGC